MNIVVIIPTLGSGGAERVTSILLNNWIKDKRNSVTLLVWDAQRIFYQLDENIKIVDLSFQYTNKFERITKQIKVLYGIRQYIIKHNPDFILSFLTQTNISVLLATLLLKRNVIISERNSPDAIKKELNCFTRKLRKYLYPKASGIIVQTAIANECIQKEFSNLKSINIYNPISDIKKDYAIKQENIILNVGRLTSQKGQIDLIEAFHKLNLDNWKLVILGEGELRRMLEEKIIELKIEDKVSLLGEVKDISSWLSKSSIFAFPSYHEGFPNALAEAMISGLPVVSYNCDTGPSELIINKKNGFLVEVGNIVELTETIDLLIKYPKLREQISSEAIKIKSLVTPLSISNKYIDFCKDVSS